jgi:hypothetical protein
MSEVSDRELLELAAKAAGLKGEVKTHGDGELWLYINETYGPWNPLINDGDALRLAIDLGMILHFDGELLAAKKDPYAATRRDIVSIAAKIGRQQCSK